MSAVAELKLAHRAIWAAGEYAAVARHFDEVPPRDLLARMGIRRGRARPGRRHRAPAPSPSAPPPRARTSSAWTSRRSCSPRRGRAPPPPASPSTGSRATQSGFHAADGAFDHVLSAFGVQFAPRHEIVAHELTGACRPGGRIGLVNWTPEGLMGELLRILGPLRAGSTAVRLGAAAVGQREPRAAALPRLRGRLRLRSRPQSLALPLARGLGGVMETADGPTVRARERLAAAGRWEECRAELLALARRRNEATDGSLLMQAEYLIAVGRKRR